MSSNERNEEKNEVIVAKTQHLIKKVNHVRGGEYIVLLLKNPVTKFPYFYLEYNQDSTELNNSGEYDYIHDMDYLEKVTDYLLRAPILMCDERTKNEVQKRLKEVSIKIERAEKLGNTIELYDLTEEKSALLKYLAEVLMPSGKIKSFNETIDKPKRAVLQNVRRFLKEVSTIDMSLYKALKEKIEIAKYTISMK